MLKQQSFTHLGSFGNGLYNLFMVILGWSILILTTLMGFNVVIVDGVDSFCSFSMCSDLTFFLVGFFLQEP